MPKSLDSRNLSSSLALIIRFRRVMISCDMTLTLLARSKPLVYKLLILFSTNLTPLYLEVFQLLLCLFRRSSGSYDLRLRCLVNLALCLLGGGVFREVFGEWDEFRGAGKVLSEWLGYSEALFVR